MKLNIFKQKMALSSLIYIFVKNISISDEDIITNNQVNFLHCDDIHYHSYVFSTFVTINNVHMIAFTCQFYLLFYIFEVEHCTNISEK